MDKRYLSPRDEWKGRVLVSTGGSKSNDESISDLSSIQGLLERVSYTDDKASAKKSHNIICAPQEQHHNQVGLGNKERASGQLNDTSGQGKIRGAAEGAMGPPPEKVGARQKEDHQEGMSVNDTDIQITSLGNSSEQEVIQWMDIERVSTPDKAGADKTDNLSFVLPKEQNHKQEGLGNMEGARGPPADTDEQGRLARLAEMAMDQPPHKAGAKLQEDHQQMKDVGEMVTTDAEYNVNGKIAAGTETGKGKQVRYSVAATQDIINPNAIKTSEKTVSNHLGNHLPPIEFISV